MAPGDVLHLLAKVPRGKLGDLRVYRGTNELVFHCAKSPACIRSKDGLEARVTLDRVGTYRTLLIAADKELPAPSGNLDADYAEAMRSGQSDGVTARRSALAPSGHRHRSTRRLCPQGLARRARG